MESTILSAALWDRQVYEELDKYEIKEDLSDQGKVLWEVFDNYYKKDSQADKIDKTIITNTITRTFPKHSTLLNNLIEGLDKPSSINLLHEVLEQKKAAVKLKLSQAFSSDKEKDIEPLLEIYDKLIAGEIDAEENSEVVIAPDLATIMAARTEEHRIKILPESVNKALRGGLLRGHHVVVFGVTDLGKTLFVLNMLRGWIADGYKVLAVFNEDPISDLIERLTVSITGKSYDMIQKHPDKAQEVINSRGWGNLVWAELAPGTIGEIRALVEEHKPDILLVDQIRNIQTDDKNFVRTLEKVAQAMRNFAKKYNLASVSVTQAGDSANGKAVLGRGDIDSSNVGIPGTTDAMIGIGATQEQEFDGTRVISFAKNKIGGVKQPIQVFFNTKTHRVE